MHLDVPTLIFTRAFATALGGIFLLLYWWQDRQARAAAWWGTANVAMAVGISLLSLHNIMPRPADMLLGPSLIDLGAALTWVAALVFNRGSAASYRTAVVVVVWIVVQTVAGARYGGALGGAIGTTGSACFYAAAAIEFCRARRERLHGRWPMVLLLVLLAAACLCIAGQYLVPAFDVSSPHLNWFGSIHFIGIVYAIGSATTLVVLLKERSEAAHKATALTDPLTGLANRRAFADRAQRAFDRSSGEGHPVSLVAFDLDCFKAINDTFGHLLGDQVLQIFADVLRKVLRPADFAARMGGEEFSAILPGCSAEAAVAIAGRIRAGFQDDGRFVNGKSVGATVSVGVATALGDSFEQTLERADAALYRAKTLGRNRVAFDEMLVAVAVVRIA